MMTDPISDLLTRVRNAQMAGKETVSMPASKVKESIVKVLIDEGYVASYDVTADKKPVMTVVLKYYQGNPVISMLKRVSRPGLRLYKGKDEIPQVQAGLGVAIVSTSKGVMSGTSAKSLNEGGEILCVVS